jgi:hypothetical protein
MHEVGLCLTTLENSGFGRLSISREFPSTQESGLDREITSEETTGDEEYAASGSMNPFRRHVSLERLEGDSS